MATYSLVGKHVRVHLYDQNGILLGAIEGRVADVAENVNVARKDGEKNFRDLAYVVDISPLRDEEGNEVPYKGPAGNEGEGWFAIPDLQVIDEETSSPPFSTFN